jgi:hypothetical protein
MHATENWTSPTAKRVPWIKGKLTGAKPPLRPKHVWAIRTTRDLALANASAFAAAKPSRDLPRPRRDKKVRPVLGGAPAAANPAWGRGGVGT